MSNIKIGYDTLSENIKMYIDTVRVDEENYQLEGWIGSFKDEISSFKNLDCVFLGHSSHVNLKFGDNKFINKNMKFLLIIPKNKISENITVCYSTEEEEIESFEKWIVYYSGFNNTRKSLIVIDDFYKDPDLIRKWTMDNLDFQSGRGSAGKRTRRFSIAGTKERFEEIIGAPIKNWNYPKYANEVFQYCTADQKTVYHIDGQTYAAMIFLTPNAPLSSGTRFYKNKETGLFKFTKKQKEEGLFNKAFSGNFYDGTRHELIDEVGNKYNRCVLFDAQQIHAAGDYFGDSIENARYFHIFFFDI